MDRAIWAALARRLASFVRNRSSLAHVGIRRCFGMGPGAVVKDEEIERQLQENMSASRWRDVMSGAFDSFFDSGAPLCEECRKRLAARWTCLFCRLTAAAYPRPQRTPPILHAARRYPGREALPGAASRDLAG